MKYWMFQGSQVHGPYEPAELSRLPGFSAETLVCPEGRAATSQKNWRRAGETAELPKPAPQDWALPASLPEKVEALGRAVERLKEDLSRKENELRLLHNAVDEKVRRSEAMAGKAAGLEERLASLSSLRDKLNEGAAKREVESAIKRQNHDIQTLSRDISALKIEPAPKPPLPPVLETPAFQPPAPAPPAAAAKPKKKLPAAALAAAAGLALAALLARPFLMPRGAKAPPEPAPEAADAALAEATGHVSVRARDGERFEDAAEGSPLLFGDEIITSAQSSAHVVFANGDAILLKGNSQLLLQGDADHVAASFSAGEFLIGLKRKLSPGQSFEVKTPAAVAAVRGTLFWGLSDEKKDTTYASFGHSISISAGGKTVLLAPGQTVVIPFGRPPQEVKPAAIPLAYLDTFAVDGSIEGLKELVSLPPEKPAAP